MTRLKTKKYILLTALFTIYVAVIAGCSSGNSSEQDVENDLVKQEVGKNNDSIEEEAGGESQKINTDNESNRSDINEIPLTLPPFESGSGYQEGAYSIHAVHPTFMNWSGVSRFNAFPEYDMNTSKGFEGDLLDFGSFVIGGDGEFYIAADRSIKAMTKEGVTMWIYRDADESFSLPSIGMDGTIYTTNGNGRLYALNSDGSLKWKVEQASTPVLGSDGTIYVSSKGIRALSPVDGALLWEFKMEWSSSLVLASDNNIYVVGETGQDGTRGLYVVNSDGKGRSLISGSASSFASSTPVIGSDGTLYYLDDGGALGPSLLQAYTPEGKIKWYYNLPHKANWTSELSISEDNVIFFGTSTGHIYAVSEEGQPYWIYDTYENDALFHQPIIDSEGKILVATKSPGGTNTLLFRIFDKEGNILSTLDFKEYAIGDNGNIIGIRSTPIIGPTGELFFVVSTSMNSYLLELGGNDEDIQFSESLGETSENDSAMTEWFDLRSGFEGKWCDDSTGTFCFELEFESVSRGTLNYYQDRDPIIEEFQISYSDEFNMDIELDNGESTKLVSLKLNTEKEALSYMTESMEWSLVRQP